MKLRRGESNLYVSDLERSATFYVEALGFEVRESSDGWRKLHNGALILTLFLAGRPGPAPAPGGVPHMSCDLLVADADIEEAYERLKASGADVGELNTWAHGRHLLFRDPDGIGWEMLSR